MRPKKYDLPDIIEKPLSKAIEAHILIVYEENEKNKTRTAKALKINRQRLYNYLDSFGVW